MRKKNQMASGGPEGQFKSEGDFEHEVVEWRVERVAWVLMLVLILAGLAGLLGSGPLSHAVARASGSALWAEYERFERRNAPSVIVIHLTPRTAQGETVRLWFNSGFFRNVNLERIDPQPERMEVGADRYIASFALNEPGGEVLIRVHFEANEIGKMETKLGLEGGPSLHLSQFVYP
jgi:hypothetical protein